MVVNVHSHVVSMILSCLLVFPSRFVMAILTYSGRFPCFPPQAFLLLFAFRDSSGVERVPAFSRDVRYGRKWRNRPERR